MEKENPKRLETIQHVESFSKANDSEAFRVLIKTSAVLVLLYALVWINTSFRIGIHDTSRTGIRMRCFILFHDCTWSCSTRISQIAGRSLIHITRTPRSNTTREHHTRTPHSNKGTHGSFFKSQRLNNLVGSIVGMYVYTPFQSWRQGHRVHHEISSNLHYKQDNGQTSSPWTVQEFKNASVLDKLWYLFAFGPLSYVLHFQSFLSITSLKLQEHQQILHSRALLQHRHSTTNVFEFQNKCMSGCLDLSHVVL